MHLRLDYSGVSLSSNTLNTSGRYCISNSSVFDNTLISYYPPRDLIIDLLDLPRMSGAISSQSSSKSLNSIGSLLSLDMVLIAFSLNLLNTYSEMIDLLQCTDSISSLVMALTLSLKKK